ncbi:TPA: hypothetical protein ACX3LL_004619 [Enterobacter asburiae]
MKKVYTAIILIVLLCGGVLSANYIFLQRHMNEVLKEDPRNDGISVWVYYKWFVNSSEINYDLRSVSAENSSLDVSRVMLQFAEKVKDYDFSKVYLSYTGPLGKRKLSYVKRFKLTGDFVPLSANP